MPPKLTPEQRIESDQRKAENMKAWKLANREKFDAYMHSYYLKNKNELNRVRSVNAKKQRELIKSQQTAQHVINA